MKPLSILASIWLALCFGIACTTDSKKPDAKATPPAKGSPVPDAIAVAKTEAAAALAAVEKKVVAAQAELAALEKRSAVAAAQVASAQAANTNQPPSPATSVVTGETALALGNLPAPDVAAALEAEKRRAATFAGQVDEARRLYAAAQTETERMKAEAAKLRTDTATAQQEAKAAALKAESAQAALVAAEKANAAALERNRAANQAALDAAEKRADEAETKAKDERHKLIFRSLVGLGIACILAGIALGVVTNGSMLVKALMLVGAGGLCIGLGQVIAHPWFDRIFGTCVGLAVIGGGFHLWHERKGALVAEAYKRTVSVLDEAGAIKDAAGNRTPLGVALGEALDKPHKKVVTAIQRAEAVKAAKAA